MDNPETVVQVKGIIAVRKFFTTPERPVTMDELKALTEQDRKDLYEPCEKAVNNQ